MPPILFPVSKSTQPEREIGLQERGARKVIKKRILKTLAMMGVLLSLAATPALAETEVDQSYETHNTYIDLQDPGAAQTFRVGKTGTWIRLKCWSPAAVGRGCQRAT